MEEKVEERSSGETGEANHGARMGGGEWNGWLQRCRESRRLVLVIVAIALLLDNMLLTTVVPIIPEFLYDIKHPNATLSQHFEQSGRATVTAVHPTSINIVTSTSPSVTTTPKCLCTSTTKTNDSQLEFLYPSTSPSSIESTMGLLGTTSSGETGTTTESEEKQRHRELLQETVAVGIMFASKAFVQLLANPIVGPLTHKIGYSIPMFTGFIIMFISTLIFAFGRSYGILFLARALQGIGSSCSSVSGMGMLAERYQDDKERGNAMGIALGGLALGVLIGPPFGGVMYEFVGKSAPFLILSALALGDGILQLLVLQPSVVYTEADPPSLKTLITDPYIVLAAGAITFANMGIAMLEPSLPIWMMDTMCASRWEQGATFLPASISYLIGTNLFGPLGHRMGRWLASLIGLVVIGICLMCIPLARSINHLIVPNAGLGFAIGMVDSSMMPQLGYLVDIRHTAVYGSVYAIGDVAFCLGFAIGPALSGTLVNSIGFEWMLFGIAILNFIYAPLMYFLRAPPTKEEKKSLIIGEKSSVRYVTYQNEEEEQ
ncbi:synaptic vesicular amine transporter isoform X1 [Apis laboriosa]|uniref:synaptic vesicular amine transporter isoform X1 n=3 Tax=Apis laboriosa TaxID=183418 RepID=UPI001CC59C50|nr:synaptic vesicular amine transporter isoform X1 [Apis laboriosa]